MKIILIFWLCLFLQLTVLTTITIAPSGQNQTDAENLAGCELIAVNLASFAMKHFSINRRLKLLLVIQISLNTLSGGAFCNALF